MIHFVQDMRRMTNRCSLVRLPFKEDLGELSASENIMISPSRTEIWTKSWITQTDSKFIYTRCIPSIQYFLPHYCMLKPKYTYQSLRVVTDVSPKIAFGYSLNDVFAASQFNHYHSSFSYNLVSFIYRHWKDVAASHVVGRGQGFQVNAIARWT